MGPLSMILRSLIVTPLKRWLTLSASASSHSSPQLSAAPIVPFVDGMVAAREQSRSPLTYANDSGNPDDGLRSAHGGPIR